MNRTESGKIRRVLPYLLGVLLCTVNMYAGPLAAVASGVSTEAAAVMSVIGGVLVIFMGAWIYMSPSHGMIGKVLGGVIGLFIMLNPTAVAGWIQGL